MDAVALGPLVRWKQERTDLTGGGRCQGSASALTLFDLDRFAEGKTCLCFRLQSREGSPDPLRSRQNARMSGCPPPRPPVKPPCFRLFASILEQF